MLKTRLRKTSINAGIAALVLFSCAFAQSSSPVDVIHTRQQGMKDLGASMKTIRDQLRQSSPDLGAIKAAGENVKKTSALISAWFPKGTGTEAGIKTGAKPDIWSDAPTFDKKMKDFIAAAGVFADLTQAGDVTAIAAGVRPISGTCKGCHDPFFNDEK